MANKFDIDSSADTHLLNETFHVFSKSPGSPTTTLGGARLKSGHTTTATDVWADEIPAFFNAATQAKFDLFQSKAVKDDLCLFDGKVYQHNGTAFVSLGTTDEVLVDGKTFSKNNKAVVKYHKGRTAINLTADNNNGDGSNNYTAKIYNAATGSTTFVPQFISAMDKMVDGIPSLAYDAVVSDSTGVLAEGLTADNDYICNSYAGVIQFNKARSQGTVTVSAWEYIGEKLTASLTDLAKKVESVTTTAGEGVQAVTDTATTAGLSVSTKEITVEGQTDPVTVKALDITVANVSAQGVVIGGDEAKLVTATGAQNIATKAASDAISGLDSTIEKSTNNGGLYIYINNGKLDTGYVSVASVSDQGVIESGSEKLFVTAADAVKIATKAANDLEIPEVADATTTSKGIVQLSATEIAGTETSDALVPTVGAVAKSVKSLKSQIETIAGAGLNYHVLGASEELPAPSETYKGIVYLKKNTSSEAGEYIEYLCVSDGSTWSWEQIGSTKTDLSEYVKTTDLAGYVKTIKVNNWSKSVDTNTTEINLGSVITGFYATEASGGINKVANSASMRALVDSDGTVDIGVIDATETAKGLVTLTSTYSATDEASAVTGKAVASAISGIDKGVTGITVNGGSKQTGDVTLNVVTGFGNSDNRGNSDYEAINVANLTNGMYGLYAVIADDTHRGVTYLYDKLATSLGSSTTATVSEKTVKGVYDTLYNIYDTLYTKIPTTYVSSVNGTSGAITLKAGGNRGNVTANEIGTSASNLWGLNVTIRGNEQRIIDGFIGDSNVYGNIGTDYAKTASLPENATKVIGNFVYDSDGKVIDTIRAERMVSGFSGLAATGLTEWVADMPNLKDGHNLLSFNTELTTFIGDLSSLETVEEMFYGCTALTTFIGDLSSLSNGFRMFSDKNGSTFTSTKLNSESVECILESIPDWTGDDEEHHLDIGVSTVITAESDVRQSVKDITGVELTATVGDAQEITYKGWTIAFFVAE